MYLLALLLLPTAVFATGMAGVTYEIPFDSINIGGGDFATSENYGMFDSVGQAATGYSSSASYAMSMAGYRQADAAPTTLTLTLSSASLDLGQIRPNESSTGAITTTVTTNSSNGYNLYVQQDADLAFGSYTIPAFSGTIASPIVWTGNGFGFSLNSGTALEAKWGAGVNFAGLPASATAIHSKTGFLATADDTVVGFKVQVGTQNPGVYTNTITFTALPQL